MAAINRSRYFLFPFTTGRRTVATGRLLYAYLPEEHGADVARYAKRLGGVLEATIAAYVVRHIEAAKATPLEDGELDNLVDWLWGVSRDRFDHWQVFRSAAPLRFAEEAAAAAEPEEPEPEPEPEPAFDYAAAAARAAKIARARELILGTGGVEFVRLKYAEQAEHMRTMWKVIGEEGLEEIMIEAIGEPFFRALRDGQARYQIMIQRRLVQERGSEVNLREQITVLREAMQDYALALIVACDDELPAQVERTRKALRPIDALREQLERERMPAGAEAAPEPAPELGEAIDELLKEEQSVVKELGLVAEKQPEDQPAPEQGGDAEN